MKAARRMWLAVVGLLLVAQRMLAETGSAESPDFTVNTVPEPAAALLALCGVMLLARKARGRVMGLMIVLLCVATMTTQTFAAPPVVTNVVAQQQPWPSFMVDIWYDVADADGHTQAVTGVVSTNSGAQYDIFPTNFTGDIGYPVAVGTNRHIAWDAGISLPVFSSDTVRVKITAEDWAPFLDVTSAIATVAYGVTAYAVAGTNNIHVVGDMWVSNTIAGGAALNFPADASWTAPAISLNVGANTLVVSGTNALGVAASDAVVVERAGAGVPFVNITNANAAVVNDITVCTLAGTNNAHVVGGMWATNMVGSDPAQTFAADASWTTPPMNLQLGVNVLLVYGTNVMGMEDFDVAVITRLPAGTGTPFLDITSTPVVVAHDDTTCSVAGTNNIQVVGGMCWTNELNGTAGAIQVTGDTFQVTDIPLGVGQNMITVNGTNAWGAMTNDSVSIIRLPAEYCIVDVSGGPAATNYPVSFVTNRPVLNDEYKTTKIVLRKISPRSFVMGSPTNELGRYLDEGPQHTVTLSSNFYMGVFEITQGQYSNVMGANPARFQEGAHAPTRPVEKVSWNTVRGGTWPGGTPGETTFMGMLSAKTGLPFDLPTEAQWEYACRAGTTNALNNNTNLTSGFVDANMNILGRYYYNGGDDFMADPVNGAHTTVGSYLVNQWELYDMHGNALEWCLDWYEDYGGNATDPPGPESGTHRVTRSGNWSGNASICRSASRAYNAPDNVNEGLGFRLLLPAGP